MQSCYFLGSALHTSLGSTLAMQLEALQKPPATPGSVTVRYTDKSQNLPYKLLADWALDDAGQKLNTVVDQVITQALEAAQITEDERRRMGLFIGTSSFDISISEQEYRNDLLHNPAALAMKTCSSQGILGNSIRKRHRIYGPDFSFNTACTASANALIYADAAIRSGRDRKSTR